MSTVTFTTVGRVAPIARGAVLVCPGVGSLALPWWPDEIERAAMTPSWVDTARPGRTPDVARGNEPLPTRRISFALSGTDLATQSVEEWLTRLEQMAKATSPTQIVLGEVDAGRWLITELSIVERDWTDNGTCSAADVVMAMRRPSAATTVVGPIKPKAKKAR